VTRGAPAMPCCPVHVGTPGWALIRLRDRFSAREACRATFSASLSTSTKSGFDDIMILSCCKALCSPVSNTLCLHLAVVQLKCKDIINNYMKLTDQHRYETILMKIRQKSDIISQNGYIGSSSDTLHM